MKTINYLALIALLNLSNSIECLRIMSKAAPDNSKNPARSSLVYLGSKTTAELSTIRKQTAVPSSLHVELEFTAATVENVLAGTIVPPNQTGAVGPKQYILACNQMIVSCDKNTGQPDGVLNLPYSSFFGTVAGNARVLYDSFAQRWYFSMDQNPFSVPSVSESKLIIAISDSCVITNDTTWLFYTFAGNQFYPIATPSDEPIYAEFNQLAFDQYAIYLTINVLPGNFSTSFGTSLIVIQKSSIETNVASPTFTIFYSIDPDPIGANLFQPPAINYDPNPQYGYIILAPAVQPGYADYTQLLMSRVINPASATPTLGPTIYINIPTYSEPFPAPNKGNLFGPIGGLQPGIYGALAVPNVRNHQLYACHDINVDQAGNGTLTGDRTACRWYQLDLTGDPTGRGRGVENPDTVPAVIQVGTIFDNAAVDPTFYVINSLMTNKNGDTLITGTQSGVNNFADVYYASRKATDPAGEVSTPINLTNTPFSYNFAPNSNIGVGPMERWGDYSFVALDLDEKSFWLTGEYAAVPNGWGIRTAKLVPAR